MLTCCTWAHTRRVGGLGVCESAVKVSVIRMVLLRAFMVSVKNASNTYPGN